MSDTTTLREEAAPVAARKSNGADAAVPSGAAVRRSEPEAAQDEVLEEKKPKTVDFRGLTLELPDTLPGTVALDYAEIEDGRKQVSPVVNLIRSIIGHDQYGDVYDKIRDDAVTVDDVGDVLRDLMEDLFGAYGTAEGESEASTVS
jgi:hypothetical protein